MRYRAGLSRIFWEETSTSKLTRVSINSIAGTDHSDYKSYWSEYGGLKTPLTYYPGKRRPDPIGISRGWMHRDKFDRPIELIKHPESELYIISDGNNRILTSANSHSPPPFWAKVLHTKWSPLAIKLFGLLNLPLQIKTVEYQETCRLLNECWPHITLEKTKKNTNPNNFTSHKIYLRNHKKTWDIDYLYEQIERNQWPIYKRTLYWCSQTLQGSYRKPIFDPLDIEDLEYRYNHAERNFGPFWQINSFLQSPHRL